MARVWALAAVVAVGGLSIVVAGDQARVPVPEIRQVKDNLYIIPGGGTNPATFNGGNTGVFVTGKGVVLVDTKLSGYGRTILDHVRTVTDKPVTTIINSHTHYDHTGSNIEFPASVEFVAHENTRANMMRATCLPVTNVDTVIPGHSNVMTWSDLREHAEFNADSVAKVQGDLKAGQSQEAIVNSYKVPEKYKSYTIDPGRLKNTVDQIARETKR